MRVKQGGKSGCIAGTDDNDNPAAITNNAGCLIKKIQPGTDVNSYPVLGKSWGSEERRKEKIEREYDDKRCE
jgi:hypothetical protein